jgi:uncharacterized protein YbjT (DUF2867 family)
MFILIAGITGTVGRECALASLERSYQVRGLGRTPENLDSRLQDELEDVYDISALEGGVAGVDAIICAYDSHPTAILDGQLLLLRAAERARVKVNQPAHWLESLLA